MAIINLSCGFGTVERETSLEGTVQLSTGEPVENYPLSVLAKRGGLFGGSNLVSQQAFHTDKKGVFSYQGVLKTGLGGLGYELQWAQSFGIQNKAYSVDTVQADIPGAYPNNQINYRFDGNLFVGKSHRVKIILKKS